MPGLRIHHADLTNAILMVPIPAKSENGTPKRVQIVLDDQGNSIVSQGVWDELQLSSHLGLSHKFIILNEVPDPPHLGLGMGNAPDVGRETYLLEQEALRRIAPAGVQAKVIPHGIKPNIRSN